MSKFLITTISDKRGQRSSVVQCLILCKQNLCKYGVLALYRTRYVGKCSSVGHDVRFERVVMVRGLKSCDYFF